VPGTFEVYCEQRWKLSRSRAYDLMAASGTVEALSPFGDTPAPANERQARALAGLDPDQAGDNLLSVVQGLEMGFVNRHYRHLGDLCGVITTSRF